jgi:acetoacetate decarboxylase
MPDSTGFGDYTETGQVIPVTFRGRQGGYSHCMFLNDEGPNAYSLSAGPCGWHHRGGRLHR